MVLGHCGVVGLSVFGPCGEWQDRFRQPFDIYADLPGLKRVRDCDFCAVREDLLKLEDLLFARANLVEECSCDFLWDMPGIILFV